MTFCKFVNVKPKERKSNLASATSKTIKVIAGSNDINSYVIKKAFVKYLDDDDAVDVDSDTVDDTISRIKRVECNNMNLTRILFTKGTTIYALNDDSTPIMEKGLTVILNPAESKLQID